MALPRLWRGAFLSFEKSTKHFMGSASELFILSTPRHLPAHMYLGTCMVLVGAETPWVAKVAFHGVHLC